MVAAGANPCIGGAGAAAANGGGAAGGAPGPGTPNGGGGTAACAWGGSAAAGASGGAWGGVGAAPGEGGATPSIVPLSFEGIGAAGFSGSAAGAGARGTFAGAFTISIVPLNFGAAAPLRLKPHLLQVVAVSAFCVPQFGQNTHHLREPPGSRPSRRASSLHGLGFDSQDLNLLFVGSAQAAGRLGLGPRGLTPWFAANYGSRAPKDPVRGLGSARARRKTACHSLPPRSSSRS
jgi:hypothetical protein